MSRRLVARVANRTSVIVFAVLLLLASTIFTPWKVLATEDNSPPQVTAYSMSATTFSTETTDQTLTLSVTLTDDQAGVCIASDCGSYNSSATQVTYYSSDFSHHVSFTNFSRTSGDDKNGTYQATATWPKGIQTGNYTVSLFLLVDKLGNSSSLTSGQLQAAVPGATGVTVTNTAADSDTTAPLVTAFSMSATSFSTETTDQTLTLTVTLTDAQAGVCSNGDCGSYYDSSETQLRMMPDSGGQLVDFTNFTRASGTDKNGTYTATGTWRHGMKKGSWSVTSFLLVDKLGNLRTLTAAQILSAVPGATGTTVTNTATHDDTTAPQLLSYNVSPTEINTENGSQTLTLTARITDDQSGVCIASDCGANIGSPSQARIVPIVGTQSATFYNFTRISGDDKDGIYTADVTIPQHAKEGIWTIQAFFLGDKVGNVTPVSLSAADIQALPGATGITIVNTATAASVTIEQDWTITSSTGSVTFPAGTVITRKDNGSFALYKMLAEAFNTTDLTNQNRAGTVVGTLRIGIPGLNLSFSKPVTVRLNVDSKYNGKTLKIQSLGEGSGSWANETSCTVSGGVCTFTASHATYFLASLVSTTSSSAKATTVLLNGSTDFFTNGVSQDVKVGDVIQFCLTDATTCAEGDLHTITVKSIDAAGNSVVLTFASTPFDATFHPGTSQDVDIDKDGTNDLQVLLNSISSDTANFTFKKLSKVAATSQQAPASTVADSPIKKNNHLVWWLVGGLVILIALVRVSSKKSKTSNRPK